MVATMTVLGLSALVIYFEVKSGKSHKRRMDALHDFRRTVQGMPSRRKRA